MRVEWNHAAVAASAREILQGFRRDILNEAKETCEVCGRDVVWVSEKLSQKSHSDSAVCGKLRSSNPSTVGDLSNPSRKHHPFYYRAYLFLKGFLAHEK
jgi:hypothetical protein